MAVSRRLARKFQETLGIDAAEDLVSWMGENDSQREEVRALIARVGEWREASRADLAETRQEIHAGLTGLREDMQSGLGELRQEMNVGFGQVREELHALQLADERLRTAIANARADLLIWSFGFWVAAVGAFALLR